MFREDIIKYVDIDEREKQLNRSQKDFKEGKISKSEFIEILNRKKTFTKMSLEEYEKLPKLELRDLSFGSQPDNIKVGVFRFGDRHVVDEDFSKAVLMIGSIFDNNISFQVRTIDVIT
jgi:hypothetical protein